MPTKKDGVMIILSSPSGAGKTTLVGLLSQRPNFEVSVSHTTRKPRQNEKQNKDYFFVSETEFKRLIGNEEFLKSLGVDRKACIGTAFVKLINFFSTSLFLLLIAFIGLAYFKRFETREDLSDLIAILKRRNSK